MAEKTASQTQQAAADQWKKIVEDQVARVQQLQDDLARFEQKGIEQMRTAVDESAKIAKESINYLSQLTAEWRKLSIDATRRAAELMTATRA